MILFFCCILTMFEHMNVGWCLLCTRCGSVRYPVLVVVSFNVPVCMWHVALGSVLALARARVYVYVLWTGCTCSLFWYAWSVRDAAKRTAPGLAHTRQKEIALNFTGTSQRLPYLRHLLIKIGISTCCVTILIHICVYLSVRYSLLYNHIWKHCMTMLHSIQVSFITEYVTYMLRNGIYFSVKDQMYLRMIIIYSSELVPASIQC